MVIDGCPLDKFLPLLIINQLEVMATNSLISLIILLSGSTVFLSELLMIGIVCHVMLYSHPM